MAVYMARLGSDGPVKIGKSNDVGTRLHALESGLWARIRLLRLFEGGHAEERVLHERFREYALGNEWYQYAECMLGNVNLPEIIGVEPLLPPFSEPREKYMKAMTEDDVRKLKEERSRSAALRSWMIAQNIDQFRLAHEIGCLTRTIEGWLAHGTVPKQRAREHLMELAAGALGPHNGFPGPGLEKLDEGSVWLNW